MTSISADIWWDCAATHDQPKLDLLWWCFVYLYLPHTPVCTRPLLVLSLCHLSASVHDTGEGRVVPTFVCAPQLLYGAPATPSATCCCTLQHFNQALIPQLSLARLDH